jgi:protein-L-isoaspartate(D-aspartate) O-methyltransferase
LKPPLLLILGTFLFTCRAASPDTETVEKDFAQERRAMVATQIQSRGIKDKKVLAAMVKVKRHLFVPGHLWSAAYADRPLPIGEGQTISQPYIVAYMTELLGLNGTEKVLEVGTGSGYQAAVLAELCDTVYSIEIVKPLAERSEKLLKDLGYKNVIVYCGDGYLGLPGHAPFDGIIVTCAPPYVPEPLKAQLKEGGRMVIPVGDYSQELVVLTKKDGRIEERSVLPVRFVPMTGDYIEGKKQGE